MTPEPPLPYPSVGLCAVCLHHRLVQTRTGSRFFLCQRSQTDPAYPRYPRLPVLRCRGFEPAGAAAATPAEPA